MDLQTNLIELSTSLVYLMSFYLVVDVVMAHYFHRESIKVKAKSNLEVSYIVAGTMVQLAESQLSKFNVAFKRAGQFGDADTRRRRLLTSLGVAVGSASSRFALFKTMHKETDAVSFHEKSVNELLDNLKEIYMKVENLSSEDAEQRLIDETMFAIADLDLRGEIMDGYSLRNPAEAHFSKCRIPGKSNQA